MNREQVLHVIRAARRVWTENDIPAGMPIGVVGSQSVLFYWEESSLPSEMLYSTELDIFLVDLPGAATSDIVNGAIGEFSMFHEANSYYADGVDTETIVLPEHWLERAKRIEVDLANESGETTEVVVIRPEDLAASKLLAGRRKDLRYLAACKKAGMLESERLLASIMDLPVDFERATALVRRYEGIEA